MSQRTSEGEEVRFLYSCDDFLYFVANAVMFSSNKEDGFVSSFEKITEIDVEELALFP